MVLATDEVEGGVVGIRVVVEGVGVGMGVGLVGYHGSRSVENSGEMMG